MSDLETYPDILPIGMLSRITDMLSGISIHYFNNEKEPLFLKISFTWKHRGCFVGRRVHRRTVWCIGNFQSICDMTV